MDNFATVPWYPNASEYEAFRATAVDSEVFFSNFEDWLQAALEHESRAADNGVLVIRVRMTRDAFDAWCQDNHSLNDVTGRSQFAECCGQALLRSG